jgi:hypothetical protein
MGLVRVPLEDHAAQFARHLAVRPRLRCSDGSPPAPARLNAAPRSTAPHRMAAGIHPPRGRPGRPVPCLRVEDHRRVHAKRWGGYGRRLAHPLSRCSSALVVRSSDRSSLIRASRRLRTCHGRAKGRTRVRAPSSSRV